MLKPATTIDSDKTDKYRCIITCFETESNADILTDIFLFFSDEKIKKDGRTQNWELCVLRFQILFDALKFIRKLNVSHLFEQL